MKKLAISLTEYIRGVEEKKIDPYNFFDDQAAYASKKNKIVNAYIEITQEKAKNRIDAAKNSPLRGAPVGVKDLILAKGRKMTGASKMLKNYYAPYDATSYKRLVNKGGVMVGKTNCDDSAMGASGETSFFGATQNPLDTNKIPGGSSSGSAAAVAGNMCLAALGTDTGGSIRQPAALCGIVGLKPTYGRVSRFGVQAMASSLDQVGPMTKTVNDAALLLSAISGVDKHDSTTKDMNVNIHQRTKDIHNSVTDISGMSVGIPYEFFEEGLDDNVKEKVVDSITEMEKAGAVIDYFSMPLLNNALAMYYIIVPAEVATNIARFDGIRYGYNKDTFGFSTISNYISRIRTSALGEEVKRRSVLGSYVLSEGYYDAFYRKATKSRMSLIKSFKKAFSKYDVIYGPTTPSVARNLGEKNNDPVKMYMADIYTVPANLANICAISVPIGDDGIYGLPVGGQFMAKQWNERILFHFGRRIETNYYKKKLL